MASPEAEKRPLDDAGRQERPPDSHEDSTGVLTGGADGGSDPRGTVDEAKIKGEGEDILSLEDLDPALNMKMHLVNNVCGPGSTIPFLETGDRFSCVRLMQLVC